MKEFKKSDCEYLRFQSKQVFDYVRSDWIDLLQWALPHRAKWLTSQNPGARNNRHIVDPTHILALRSYVAGFLEGNTSASRPWYRQGHPDEDRNRFPENREWLDKLTRSTLNILSNSNFYNAAGLFYYEFGVVNTGAYLIDELKSGRLFFHNLVPGSYYVINNAFGEAVVMVIEKSFNVKALVDKYWDPDLSDRKNWNKFSPSVKKMYDESNYKEKIAVVQVIKENPHFDVNELPVGDNRRWVSIEYELSSEGRANFSEGINNGYGGIDLTRDDSQQYLRIEFSKRKPFIVGKSDTSGNFEYGEKGPTLDCLGLIKSLNKKAISKDQAIEQMLRPALQGPANLKKSYVTTQSNSFVPLDATSLKIGGRLQSIFEVNPAIAALLQDQTDLRGMVDKLYYADFLLFLSKNPKTRTATEAAAVVQEQQLIIGPNLQSLNYTHNVPVVDFVTDYALDEDPFLPPPPPGLQGSFLRTDFISTFAQAQKMADLPNINQYIAKMAEIAALDPRIWDKVNIDKIADLYEDRLFLPAGLNNAQSKVEKMRAQQQAMAQRQQAMNETIPNLAKAAKDASMAAG